MDSASGTLPQVTLPPEGERDFKATGGRPLQIRAG
jgi:hypothetical protein